MAKEGKKTLDFIGIDVTDKTTLGRLHRKFGNDGRLFWYELLRLLGRTEGYSLDLTDQWIREDYLEGQLFVSSEKGIEILNSLADWGKICKKSWYDKKIIWCQNLIDRHKAVFSKRKSKPLNPADITVKQDKRRIIDDSDAETTNKECLTPVSDADIRHSIVEYSIEENSIENSLYYESDLEFLKDWAEIRLRVDNKKTNIKKLAQDELFNFNLLKKEFIKEEFKNSIEGLFSQKQMFEPNRLRPRHFLADRNIEKYLDAFLNKIQLFKNNSKQKNNKNTFVSNR